MPKRALVTEIPAGWSHVQIGDMVMQVGERVKVEAERFYNMTGVKWYGEGVFARETVLGKEMSASYVMPLISGALIYNRLFAWKGSFAVVPENFGEQYVSNEFPQFVVDLERVLPEYLYLYCMSSKVMEAVNRASAGSAAVSRNRLKESAFIDIDFLLPPLDVQRAIVDKWRNARMAADEAFALADKIEKDAAREFLHGLGLAAPDEAKPRKAFAVQWSEFERWGVNMCRNAKNRLLISKYPTLKIKDICRIGSGGTPSRKIAAYYDKGYIPWVKTTEVRNEVILETEEKITQAGLQNSSAKLYPAGSLVIAMYGQGATRGRTAKLGIEAATNQACCVLYDMDSRIEIDFLWFYLIGEYDKLRALASGNNQPNLNAEMIANYDVPLPPIEIQQTLVAAIDEARQQAAAARQKAETLKTQAAAEIEAAILGSAAGGIEDSSEQVDSVHALRLVRESIG